MHPELELSGAEMRRLVEQAMERIVPFVESLPTQPAADLEGATGVARTVAEPLPEHGIPFDAVLARLFDDLIPKSFNTAGPGYLAYIPGGGLFQSAVADLISDAVNRYVGVWMAAPALSQVEATVLSWFAEIVGYPPSARGLLTTGGSLANFAAIIAARRKLLPEAFWSGTLYASDQVHHSVVKSAMLAGFPAANVKRIPADEKFRLPPKLLQDAVDADLAAGMTPFMVVASAGTTNTGAVDDLSALADIAEQKRLWLHVDAAYGGFFMLTDRGRRTMRGIERSNSVTLDPHKALFLPYGTGSLLVRDGNALKQAHSLHAEYLPPTADDPDMVDFSQYSPELSRAFRGLRVWLPLKLHGIAPFSRNLDEKLDLAQRATDELHRIPGVEIVAKPQLSLVAFRLVFPGKPDAELDRINREVMRLVNERNRVYLTGTTVRGIFVIRICVLSFRTHLDRVLLAVNDIRECAASLG